MKVIRRVASGQRVDNTSTVVSDEQIPGVEIAPGAFMYPVWGSDEIPEFPLSGQLPGFKEFFPTVDGYRFIMIEIPPSAQARDKAEYIPLSQEDTARLGENMSSILEEDEPGMHTTDTVDLEVVLEGEAGLEFDNGEKLFLSAGDFFIQNGTRHRWFNRGDVPARVACALIGGKPRR